MKTKMITLILLFTTISFISNAQTEHKARVKSVYGIPVYIRSEPLEPYTVFQFYKAKSVWNEKESWMIPNMVERIKKEFPETEGIIFIDNLDLKECELIKYVKEKN